ncbi:response regulator [Sphingobium estronivorans]|uniref:response regulator n=1 Tax=Sphingobium estronivorans TaxID=1577690 RepID=UPI0012397AC7|nr:response regulator [Sphingobium estronivorans]
MQREPVKILAVDDVPENLAALDALLRCEGLELLRAGSGIEALELLLVHDVALALLDVQMPGMDGFELAELMRGTERTRRVPIIFLTAVATDERRRFRGYETGAVDYLLKPVDPQIVRNKVDIFIELFRHRQELAHERDSHAAALARLQAHSDNSPLALVELDADQRIVAWSKGAERLFGWRHSEVAGFCPAQIKWLHQEDAGGFAALIQEMIAGDRPRASMTLQFNSMEGAVLHCECYGSALLDGAGGLISVALQILDVTDRKRAEDTRKLLVGELNHRVKNTLASVQAIATQTLRHSSGPSDFAPTFIGRIHALAGAHSLLSNATWQAASLRDLVEGQLSIGAIDVDRFEATGPDLDLQPEPALHLALVLHELVTNAHKYGALSVPGGRVSLNWRVEDKRLMLDWQEQGGPAVSPPSRRGFGTALIERSLRADGGSAEPRYTADGMGWTLTLPILSGVRQSKSSASTPLGRGGRSATGQQQPADLHGRRLLLVEDETLIAFELTAILKDAGIAVSGPVSTVDQALEQIAQADFDGALVDGNLQGQSVDAIVHALAARNIPFLFVSGYDSDHLPAEFEGVAVIGKPFKPEALLSAVATMGEMPIRQAG